MKTKVSSILIIIVCTFFLAGCSQKNSTNTNINLEENIIPTNANMNTLTVTPTPSSTQETFASVVTKDGEIVLKLYTDKAPNTVANFLKKASASFYKGLIFHRVIPGFMAQGGDPLGNGTGGGDIASEINNIPFKRGTIGLARGGNKAISNDSQFFICFSTEGCQHLTGDYVNFGEVVSGLDVLDKIQQGDKIIDVTSKTK